MKATERDQLEERLRALCEAGEYGSAVALGLEGYGAEIRKLMWVVLKEGSKVDDAFGMFSEQLLKSLPDFRWQSSFRTWAHAMARNICLQATRSPAAREYLMTEGGLDRQAQRERTETPPWVKTDVKRRFRALQERLSPHEQRAPGPARGPSPVLGGGCTCRVRPSPLPRGAGEEDGCPAAAIPALEGAPPRTRH